MWNTYRTTKSALVALSEEVHDYAYDYYSLPAEWKGDEVVITACGSGKINRFSTDRPVIETAAKGQVIWLLGRLRDAFGSLLDAPQRKEFYARLTDVIWLHERTSNREHRTNSILRAAMDEAFAILAELEEGKFALHGSSDYRETTPVRVGETELVGAA